MVLNVVPLKGTVMEVKGMRVVVRLLPWLDSARSGTTRSSWEGERERERERKSMIRET